MAAGTCNKADCTVATTGQCLLSQLPQSMSHFRSGDGAAESCLLTLVRLRLQEIPTLKGRKEVSFRERTWRRVQLRSCARYSHLIAILGSTNAGKTCLLSSLYLMASGGTLPPEYLFAGSLTLQAFEDRARGLRNWEDGKLPAQLADHTFLADPRQPSLLHLAIREAAGERQRLDILLTDLPGEWTDNLVLRAANAGSFEFLQRADGIILVVDGTVLMSEQRHAIELQHMRQFVRTSRERGEAHWIFRL